MQIYNVRNYGYGFGRSASMAYGSCFVEICKDMSWKTMVKNGYNRKRPISLPPFGFVRWGTESIPGNSLTAFCCGWRNYCWSGPLGLKKITEQCRQKITDRLKKTSKNEAYVFILGKFSPRRGQYVSNLYDSNPAISLETGLL